MNIPEQQHMPWLDGRVPEDAMKHLWEIVDTPTYKSDPKPLAGNISKSVFVQDKDNWFYENVLKEMSEYMYFKDSWSNYFEVVIAKKVPPPTFTLKRIWVNYQKQHEFNPPHYHDGLYSFVVFMRIPTHWKEQHALQFSANSNAPCASDFQFLFGRGNGGPVQEVSIPLCPSDEGRILFFPAWLMHQVFPFYGTEWQERVTIAGNIDFQVEEETIRQRRGTVHDREKILEDMETQVKILKEEIQRDKY